MNYRILRFGLALTVLLGAQTTSTDLYYLTFLRPAPDRKPLPKADAERIQSTHMANIRGMAQRGVLVAAGPFGDTPPTISGVFVMKAGSLEEARAIAAQDPTVVEHRNTVDVHAWRGPNGIGLEYRRLHQEKPETAEDMGVHPFFLLHRGPGGAERRADLLRAHEDYLGRLRRDGKIGAAGPIEGGSDLEAVVIFERIPEEEARNLMDHDPAVQADALRVESHRWWCAAHVLPH